MEQHRLGRTELRVSQFGLGCGNFGGIGSAPAFFGQGETEAEAFALLDEAVELGINFLDTADAYGGGRPAEHLAPVQEAMSLELGADDHAMISRLFSPAPLEEVNP